MILNDVRTVSTVNNYLAEQPATVQCFAIVYLFPELFCQFVVWGLDVICTRNYICNRTHDT